jgi:predicted Zn-ribbon and HTH transcriptional regulator/DNA-binding transcriptional ArsR family regulator
MNAAQLVSTLTKGLGTREKEVIVGRFGLKKGESPETLAALGERHGVTRERIRQIEGLALSAARSIIRESKELTSLVKALESHLESAGGIRTVDEMLSRTKDVLQGATERHLELLAEASALFAKYPEDHEFASFFYRSEKDKEMVRRFVKDWIAFLEAKKHEVLDGAYGSLFDTHANRSGVKKDRAATYVALSKEIGTSPFGDQGLLIWPEIHPKTIRDRIYLILRRAAEPLHFRTIAQSVNGMSRVARKASAPTVHNELIKDARFVLVGRGMYALHEHGYEPGTAKEVIRRVLMASANPLTPREIVAAVQKERLFKENTVLVNLQNKNLFVRTDDGRYAVREA